MSFLRQAPVQKQQEKSTQIIALIGGATDTIFPELAHYLLYNSGAREAARGVVAIRKLEEFRSFIDFIFCEMFPQYLEPCFLYYQDKGPTLKNILTEEEIKEFDRLLITACKLATVYFNKQEGVRWYDLLELVSKK